ncbi:MAG TPA: hypothetical protein VI875_01115 [Candidatus Norongarragalinales archaeon]|nr:hypothetical protein [Candidatus Norongarragalinales archaeon]
MKMGIAIFLLLAGFLLAGCVSGGQQTSYSSPTAPATASQIPEFSEGELAFPTLDENTGFEDATITP